MKFAYEDCCECSGSGWIVGHGPCEWCDGTGRVSLDDLEDQPQRKESLPNE